MQENKVTDIFIESLISGIKPDGSAIDIKIVIKQPTNLFDDQWECLYSLDPLIEYGGTARGNDTFSALCMAASMIIVNLVRFRDGGGRLRINEDHEYPLEYILQRLYKRPKKKVPINTLLNRITGFSTPIFGLSWDPPEDERTVASHILTLLEDQRLLFSEYDYVSEIGYIRPAVYALRDKLTNEMKLIDRSSNLARSIGLMRSACRRFLDRLPNHEGECITKESWYGAFGELRATFGMLIAEICSTYGFEVEEELATILPLTWED